ncbi:MAG: S8 family serine peptidase, partial [Thauera sp.]
SAIRGVGAARARSLEAALPGGVAVLCAGVPDELALMSLPGALRRQIQDLAAFVSVAPPAGAALAWAHPARRLLDGPPDGASAVDWQTLVVALAPLLDAFDRSVARVVCGETLFR